MYILINCSFDGDQYKLVQNLEEGKKAFKESIDTEFFHKIYLLEVEVGKEFGFGSRGDVFGANVIEEWENEEDEEEFPITI